MSTRLKNILNCIIFSIFVLTILIFTTYLMRGAEVFGRKNIVGIKNEPRDSIDVVVIGPSAVYRYWDPMKAYHEHGIVSYDYSTSGMTAASTISSIKDIRKTQDPQLFVVEIRSFLSKDETREFGRDTKNVFDAHDISLERTRAIHYFCSLYAIPVKDALSEYIEIIQYHDNYDAFKEPDQWKLIDNRLNPEYAQDNVFKGFTLAARHNVINTPSSDVFTGENKAITSTSEQILTDLLEYSRKEKINLLLVASPFFIDREGEEEINYITALAEKYEVPLLDTNKYFAEMGLDFARDFDDVNHVNNFGSDKYTAFLADYVCSSYQIPDRRNDAAYDAWKSEYDRYLEMRREIDNNTIAMISGFETGVEAEEEIDAQ